MIELMCLKDANETTDSRKCCICHYWYFLKKNIRFQPKACNTCLDLAQKVLFILQLFLFKGTIAKFIFVT